MGPMPSSRSTTPLAPSSPLATTSSPTGPTTRETSFSVTSSQELNSRRSHSILSQPTWAPSTGSPRVPSPQSRIRDSADHAGPSPPLEPWKVASKSRPEPSLPSPNRNLSTVTTSALKAAMEVPWLEPSSGSRTTRLRLSLTTSTPPRPAPATPATTLASSTALASPKSPPTPHPHSWPPSKLDQPQSPSRPTSQSSRPTRAESLTLLSAEPSLTTVSSRRIRNRERSGLL